MSRLGVEFSDDELEEMVNRSNIDMYSKAELLQVSILFRTQFPSLGIFINKKSWDFEKTKAT